MKNIKLTAKYTRKPSEGNQGYIRINMGDKYLGRVYDNTMHPKQASMTGTFSYLPNIPHEIDFTHGSVGDKSKNILRGCKIQADTLEEILPMIRESIEKQLAKVEELQAEGKAFLESLTLPEVVINPVYANYTKISGKVIDTRNGDWKTYHIEGITPEQLMSLLVDSPMVEGDGKTYCGFSIVEANMHTGNFTKHYGELTYSLKYLVNPYENYYRFKNGGRGGDDIITLSDKSAKAA